MSDDTIVKIALPLPVDVIAPIMNAVDQLWPGATALYGPEYDPGFIHFRVQRDVKREVELSPAESRDESVMHAHNLIEGDPETAMEIASHFAALLKSAKGAKNYLELHFASKTDPEGQRIAVIVLRPGQKSPNELRLEETGRADEATDFLRQTLPYLPESKFRGKVLAFLDHHTPETPDV